MKKSETKLTPKEELDAIEAHLAGTLRRVQTPKGLTQRLRDRMRIPEVSVLAERITNWRFFFVVFGSIISGMLLVITVARAMFHLFGRRSA